MREGRYIVRRGDEVRRKNAALHIETLDSDTHWLVEITQWNPKRTLDQNAYIHAVPLKMISDKTGYPVEDIKQYLCGEFSGWQEFEMFGKKRMKPMLTTSKMTTVQMGEFIEFLIWYGAEKMGLNIPYPNEEVT